MKPRDVREFTSEGLHFEEEIVKDVDDVGKASPLQQKASFHVNGVVHVEFDEHALVTGIRCWTLLRVASIMHSAEYIIKAWECTRRRGAFPQGRGKGHKQRWREWKWMTKGC